MTTGPESAQPTQPIQSTQPSSLRRAGSWTESLKQGLSLLVSLALAGGALVALLWVPSGHNKAQVKRPDSSSEDEVHVQGRRIIVKPDSSLAAKLAPHIHTVSRRDLSIPLLTVT